MATCSLRSCAKKAVDESTGKVDVRGFQVTTEETRKLEASWTDNGDAIFHGDCWRQLKTLQKDGKLSELEDKLVKEANKTAEVHDSADLVKTEAKRIVQMLRNSDYCIAFTGAGISTAAGIGDFRGKEGKWTNNDKVKEHGAKGGPKKSKAGGLAQLRPTYTHEAICKLVEMGILKFLISQNTDGLHRLSGVPAAKMSELHGNAFAEKCENCERRYDLTSSYGSDPKVKASVPPKKCERCRINHRTGRKCQVCGGHLMNTIINFGDYLDKVRTEIVNITSLFYTYLIQGCGGYLMNTIINFGDFLEEPVINLATENARKADLVLCLGTTLMVSPANSLVEMGKQPIRLIICNRQKTPYDNYCFERDKQGVPVGARIFGDCDKLMREVMLGILGKDGLEDWEEGSENRWQEYDKKRKPLKV